MGGGLRSAFLTLGSLVIAAGLSGCAWLGQITSSSEEPAPVAAQPAAEPATAAPAPVTAAPATAAPAAVEVVSPAPSVNGDRGYTELPGLSDVRFRSGQVRIVKADHKVLDNLVRWLKENPDAVLMIEGHTDDLGTPEGNMVVAEKRASAVMRYLISRGLAPSRVTATSVGSERPVCTEKTDTCRAKNRRARFLVKPR